MSTVPIWPEFVLPILRVLEDGEVRTNREIRSLAFDRLGLSEEARSEVLPSGESRAHNRAGWTVTHLNKAGWIERVNRGTYRITSAGAQALLDHAGGFHDYSEAGKVFSEFWPNTSKIAKITVAPATSAAVVSDPIEQIEEGIAQITSEVAASLLERLRTSDPGFFEDAVVKVLLGMGYGGAEQRGKRIGGTGDGGVDGVINQDALGLDQIYVQAKRYAVGNNVGREAIQAFIGALHGFGASRGVFITSSDFTSGALSYAQQVPTRIVLINGERLAALMIKYGVGVQTRQTYAVVEIDEDFFE